MRTIADQWALFERAVMPKDAPAVQRQEMRRAFYAGCEGMLRLQFEIGAKSVSEDAGVRIIEGWHDECRRFAAAVATGKA